MEKQLREGLARLADLVDPAHLKAVERLQEDIWAHRPTERIPVLLLEARPPEWPLFPYHEALENPEKMLWNELVEVYRGVTLRDDRILAVRPFVGPGAIASLLGARLCCTDDVTPWVEPVHSSQAIREIVDRGVPDDMNQGLGGKVLEMARLYRHYLDDYPPLREHVHIFPCDTEGGPGTAHVLWGEEIYLALHDDPQLVHALLNVITETTIAFTKRFKEISGEPLDLAYHFYYRVPGGVRIVDDVAVHVSAAMYQDFFLPYNERIFAAFGGGYMHYCGDRLHSHHLRLKTRGLRGLELGFDNPKRNPAYTLESICEGAAQHGVTIIWIVPELPSVRPAVTTGLIYGLDKTDLPWDQAAACLAKAKTFWLNEPFKVAR